MSGIEIAGLVLGAFPVALTTLEKYREVARTFNFWREIRSEYSNCRQELAYQQLMFIGNLKQLLLPLAADDDTIDQLMKDPGGPCWSDKSIVLQLQKRLSDSYALYLEIVEAMQKTMDEVQEELALNKAEFQAKVQRKETLPKAPANSYRPKLRGQTKKISQEYELYRLKFTFGESTRKRLFKQLATHNERLEGLLQKQDYIAKLEAKLGAHRKASGSKAIMKVDNFWRHADRLYRSLAQAWKCSCYSHHYAKLMLKHRHEPDIEFMLVFLFKPAANSLGGMAQAWHLQEANVKLSGGIKTSATIHPSKPVITPAAAKTVPSHRTATLPRSALRIPGGKRRARETIANFSPTVTITVPTATIATARLGADSSSKISEEDPIKSLCHSFSKDCSTSCFGFLEEDDSRYYLYPVKQNVVLDGTEPITLAQLLEGDTLPRLTRRQRYSLALTLASSFMQLRGSTWMRSTLGKSDISFLRDIVNPNVLLLDRPYITRDFSNSEIPRDLKDRLIPHINTLGITLLELCFGMPIEKFEIRSKYPPGDSETKAVFDRVAAIDFLYSSEVEDEAGPDYASAVTWCLLGCKNRTGGEAWRTELLEQVVHPLELCHQFLNVKN